MLHTLLDLLFPPRCIFCRKILPSKKQDICPDCERTLPVTDASNCKQNGNFFEFCVSPLLYRDSVRDSILRFKFHGKTAYAEAYGRILAKCIEENLAGKYDIITWVPLSRAREKKRGYDQAMLLAMATALSLDDIACETLRKHTDVQAQSGISDKSARRANVSGVYEVSDSDLVAGKRILIIDDVITTGATLSECARVLLMAGAEEIYCAALSRA